MDQRMGAAAQDALRVEGSRRLLGWPDPDDARGPRAERWVRTSETVAALVHGSWAAGSDANSAPALDTSKGMSAAVTQWA